MANPSFALLEVPVLNAATGELAVKAAIWTSRGSRSVISRIFPPSGGTTAQTPAQLAASLKALAAAVEAKEQLVPATPPPSPFAVFVGIRYDATKAAGTVLAAVDTPADSGAPPAGGD